MEAKVVFLSGGSTPKSFNEKRWKSPDPVKTHSLYFPARVRLADWLKSTPHKSFLYRYSGGPFSTPTLATFSLGVRGNARDLHSRGGGGYCVFLGKLYDARSLSPLRASSASLTPTPHLVCRCADAVQADGFVLCGSYTATQSRLFL